MEYKKINISTSTMLSFMVMILGVWLLYVVRDIMALFFVSIILAATLDPMVDWMGKRKIPRPLGTFIIYVVVLSALGMFISLIIPPLVGQFKEFSENVPQYTQRTDQLFSGIETYAESYGVNLDVEGSITESISRIFESSGEVFSTTVSVFNFIISFVVVLSLTFYILVKEEGMKKFIATITPKKHRVYAASFYDRARSKIGRWVLGQFAVMGSMFLMSWAVFTIMGVPFALVIAIIAGVMEIIPYIGPIISAIVATFLGFFISPVMGILILATFTVLQQIEGHVLVPQIMRKAVGLNPVVTILVLLIGAKLGGVVGAILSIPLATVVGMFIGDIMDKKEEEKYAQNV